MVYSEILCKIYYKGYEKQILQNTFCVKIDADLMY